MDIAPITVREWCLLLLVFVLVAVLIVSIRQEQKEIRELRRQINKHQQLPIKQGEDCKNCER